MKMSRRYNYFRKNLLVKTFDELMLMILLNKNRYNALEQKEK